MAQSSANSKEIEGEKLNEHKCTKNEQCLVKQSLSLGNVAFPFVTWMSLCCMPQSLSVPSLWLSNPLTLLSRGEQSHSALGRQEVSVAS